MSEYVHSRRPGLPVVVTEYTSFNFGDLDAGQEASSQLDFTLDIADTLLAHYRLGADAALYRDAVDYLQPGHDAITRWGLLRSPTEDFAPREWYYGLLQVLPYLQPGARVLETHRQGGEDLGLLALQTVDNQVALFFVNQQDVGIDVDLTLSGIPDPPSSFAVTRTDSLATALRVGAIELADGSGLVHLPPRSLTTLLRISWTTPDHVRVAHCDILGRHTTGLRGTGSHDVCVERLFVPERPSVHAHLAGDAGTERGELAHQDLTTRAGPPANHPSRIDKTPIGYDYHSLIDDHSRFAYSEIVADEKAAPRWVGYSRMICLAEVARANERFEQAETLLFDAKRLASTNGDRWAVRIRP